eukprot:COSAG06_NODE_1027_length_11028_cov_3.385031_9_plen_56_part_00
MFVFMLMKMVKLLKGGAQKKAFFVPIGCEVAQPKLNERGSAPLFVAYSEHEDQTP